MNERIKELKDNTLDKHFSHTWSTMDYEDVNKFAEKFAELIVEECVALMKFEKEYYSKPVPYESREYYERCRAKEDAFDDAARLIKNHFGVEE